MTDDALAASLERAEAALGRVERAAARLAATGKREQQLKATVREVVAELDSLIAGGRG
ncbi:hypothetical protein [Sphingomonas mesophila]|uniref:hypothetical protein n=1 Tax=Sphingomonas mesophila TaxID=2303576 RepID=UPI0013C2FF06|nr:hypothetical protein [Sphingomonas mesophila]